MDPSDDDRSLRALLRETEGAVFAEYVTIMAVVTVTAAVATAALGIPLLRFYRYAHLMLALPFP